MRFLRKGQSPIVKAYQLLPTSRYNVSVNSDVPELGDGEWGAEVQVLNYQPIVVEKAHCDATPVHAGLGNAKTCDLRVSFPGGRSVVARGIAANAQVLADLTSGRIRPK